MMGFARCIPGLLLWGAWAAQAAPPPAPTPPAAASTTTPPEATAASTLLQAPLRIAVYDLGHSGIEPRVAQLFTDSLLAELRKLSRVSVLSLDEVRALLDMEAQKQLMGCDESSCLAEIAQALGADVLILGGVSTNDDSSAIALKRVDTVRAEVVQSYTQQLKAADGEELLAAVGPAVEELFPDVALKTGAVRGVSPELALRLHPPPIPVWGFAGAAGGTAVAAVAVVATGVWWATADAGFQALLERAKETPQPASDVAQQQATLQTANASFWASTAVFAGAAVITAVLVPFVDWDNVGAAAAVEAP